MRSIHLTHTQARLVSDCSSLRETYSLNHQHWYSWIPHSRCLWGTWSGSMDTWTGILSGNNKTELDFPQEKFEFFIQKPKKLHSRDYIFINFQRHSMHKKKRENIKLQWTTKKCSKSSQGLHHIIMKWLTRGRTFEIRRYYGWCTLRKWGCNWWRTWWCSWNILNTL